MAAAGVDDLEEGPEGLTSFEGRLVNILALLLVQERKQSEQIALLNRAGFRPIEIAALIGTTRNTVSVELSNQKKKRSKKATSKKKKRARKSR
jgi:hypothetical protein